MTRAELVTRRAAYIQAETDILTGGQSYSVPGLHLTRANLKEVQDMIKKLDADIMAEDNNGPSVRAGFGNTRS